MLPSKFQVNLSFGSGGEAKTDFQDGNCGGHLGIPIEMILPLFNQQVTPMLPTQFQVNWPFGLGGEGKNRFSRWRPRWPSLILDRELFELFLIHKSPQCFLPSQLAFREKLKIEFQDGHHSSTLGFLVRRILDIFWSTSHPNASYQVSSQLAFQFRRRSEKQIFKATSYISDRKDFSYFWSTSLPDGLLVQDKKRKIDFQDSCHGGHLGFQIGMI